MLYNHIDFVTCRFLVAEILAVFIFFRDIFDYFM